MKVVKHKTDNENLLFIGFDGFEEFYQDTTEVGGWSFMGLRPNTEEELRELARETDFEDYIGVSEIPHYLDKYIDYDKFADDMEEEWEERHDVQATRESEEGETLYLGFGTGTSWEHYFKEKGITDYESYLNHFEYVGLTNTEFKKFTGFKK